MKNRELAKKLMLDANVPGWWESGESAAAAFIYHAIGKKNVPKESVVAAEFGLTMIKILQEGVNHRLPATVAARNNILCAMGRGVLWGEWTGHAHNKKMPAQGVMGRLGWEDLRDLLAPVYPEAVKRAEEVLMETITRPGTVGRYGIEPCADAKPVMAEVKICRAPVAEAVDGVGIVAPYKGDPETEKKIAIRNSLKCVSKVRSAETTEKLNEIEQLVVGAGALLEGMMAGLAADLKQIQNIKKLIAAKREYLKAMERMS